MNTVLHLSDAEDTFNLGVAVGRLIRPGGVVALIGDLGAGKTCFTQGLAVGLGVPPDMPVSSPTFALVHEYPGKAVLYHMDVYRIDGEEFLASGLDEYFDQGGVCAVEWAERIADELPEERLVVTLEYAEDGGRRAVLEPYGKVYEDLLRSVLEVWREGPVEK